VSKGEICVEATGELKATAATIKLAGAINHANFTVLA
jgi:hypothetical protein